MSKTKLITITHGEMVQLFSDDEKLAKSVYNLAVKYLSPAERRRDELEFRTNKDIPYQLLDKRRAYDVQEIIDTLNEKLKSPLPRIRRSKSYSWRDHKDKIFKKLNQFILKQKDK